MCQHNSSSMSPTPVFLGVGVLAAVETLTQAQAEGCSFELRGACSHVMVSGMISFACLILNPRGDKEMLLPHPTPVWSSEVTQGTF